MQQAKKVIVVGPITPNGRVVGGIGTMLSSILDEASLFKEKGYILEPFSTCLIKRPSKSAGHLRWSNVTNYFKCRKLLKNLCRKEKPNIVYLHTSVGIGLLKDLFLCRAIKPFIEKIVIHIHSSDPEAIFLKSHFLKRVIIKNLKRYCKEIIVLSSSIRSYFISLGFEEEHCHFVPNFTPMKFSKEEMVEKLKKRSSDPVINLLFVGSLTKNKGFFDLLESINQIQKEYRLTVCGLATVKNDEEKINSLARSNKKIKFLGYVSGLKKRQVFLDSDVILLPSYTEGLPVCLIEGITFGCYVIATPVGSIPEYFSNCGRLVPVGNQQALKEAIDLSIQNKQNLSSKQTRNHDYSSTFSARNFVDEICNIFSR